MINRKPIKNQMKLNLMQYDQSERSSIVLVEMGFIYKMSVRLDLKNIKLSILFHIILFDMILVNGQNWKKK